MLALLCLTAAGAWAQNTVTWDTNTWADGWTSDVKTHTVDGVTVTAGGTAVAMKSSSSDNLYIYASAVSTNTITFSSDAPFNRIEFTKATPSSTLYVSPLDGWSVSSDGTTVTWEGTATKSLVCETCTLTVSKIKFFLEDAAEPQPLDLTEVEAGKQWTLAMPAGNVVLHVEYEPELTATFKAANALTIEAGKATVSVTENGQPVNTATLADGKLSPLYQGQTVILKASEGYKFRKVEVKKGGAGPLAAAFKDGAKFKVGYKWNSINTTYLEFTNSGGTYSLTSVSGLNEANGFNSSTLTVKDGNVLALDVVCHPEGSSKMDRFCAQIEFDATSSTYKYSSKGSGFTGIISVSVNDADITSQLTEAN